MNENAAFCSSCGAKQATEGSAQPLPDDTANSASIEATDSSEAVQIGQQSPTQQQDHSQPVQNFVQPAEKYVLSVQKTNPPQNALNQEDLRKPMSVWQYLLIFIIMAVPILNIVMFFIWAFGGRPILTKKTWPGLL